jgi:hypothetical protein
MYRKQMKYNRITERYDIPEISVYYYYYDALDQLKKVITKSLEEGVMVNKAKQMYFYPYSLLRKVPVCHNGHTIYVSRQALKAHYAHGDCIGICEPEQKKWKDDEGDDERWDDEDNERDDDKDYGNRDNDSFHKFNNGKSCKVYPNPVITGATVAFGGKKVSRVELLTMSGNKLRTYNARNKSELKIHRGSLRKGIYLLRIYSDDVENIKIIVN